MKTSDLIGKPLDWAVAKCEDEAPTWDEVSEDWFMGMDSPHCFLKEFSPSTDWFQGGPIIEREGIFPTLTNIHRNDDGSVSFTEMFRARTPAQYLDHDEGVYGPTPLMAAMRCYVASKLGDEVNIPKELLK